MINHCLVQNLFCRQCQGVSLSNCNVWRAFNRTYLRIRALSRGERQPNRRSEYCTQRLSEEISWLLEQHLGIYRNRKAGRRIHHATGTVSTSEARASAICRYENGIKGNIKVTTNRTSQGYTTIINALDYTSCAIPVTQVRKDIDRYPVEYTSLNEVDQAIHDDCKEFLARCDCINWGT